MDSRHRAFCWALGNKMQYAQIWPKAGQLRLSWFLPQNLHSLIQPLLTDGIFPDGSFTFSFSFTALNPDSADITFMWTAVLSAAPVISFLSVNFFSLSKFSRTLAVLVPVTSRSRRSWSGVIDSKSQFAAIWRSSVKYWSTVSDSRWSRVKKTFVNSVFPGNAILFNPAYNRSDFLRVVWWGSRESTKHSSP